MAKLAVILSDMENDFFDPKGKIMHFGAHIVPNVKMLCDEARKRGIPIIFTGDALRPDKKTPEYEIWSEHATKGTWGAKFLDILGKPTVRVDKEGFQPCFGEHGKELIKVLRDLDVDTLILGGVCEVEVITMAYTFAVEPGLRDPDRPELGWDLVIPNDCVADCGEMRTFDAKKDLHLLTGDQGSQIRATTVWELVAKDFDVEKIPKVKPIGMVPNRKYRM